jgi:hypothetical protein
MAFERLASTCPTKVTVMQLLLLLDYSRKTQSVYTLYQRLLELLSIRSIHLVAQELKSDHDEFTASI